eukprot:2763496-Prymnesium_polylepis.1
MKFLASGAFGALNDVLYEIRTHESSATIGTTDTMIGYTIGNSSLLAVVLHRISGDARDMIPKLNVHDSALQHGLWVLHDVYPWDQTGLANQRCNLRIVSPNTNAPITAKLGHVMLANNGQLLLGQLAITPVEQLPDLSLAHALISRST